jgi:hypothetical protein
LPNDDTNILYCEAATTRMSDPAVNALFVNSGEFSAAKDKYAVNDGVYCVPKSQFDFFSFWEEICMDEMGDGKDNRRGAQAVFNAIVFSQLS